MFVKLIPMTMKISATIWRGKQTGKSIPPLNRTHNGMPPAGHISFWPLGVMPLLAGQLQN